MENDPVGDLSNVVGVTGQVEVNSMRDLVGHVVIVTTHELTRVARGAYPTPPQRLREGLFRQYLDQLQFTGQGKPESLLATLPLLTGAGVPEADRVSVPVGAVAGPAATGGAARFPGDSP